MQSDNQFTHSLECVLIKLGLISRRVVVLVVGIERRPLSGHGDLATISCWQYQRFEDIDLRGTSAHKLAVLERSRVAGTSEMTVSGVATNGGGQHSLLARASAAAETLTWEVGERVVAVWVSFGGNDL